MERLPGYDDWKTTPMEARPEGYCELCEEPYYEGDRIINYEGFCYHVDCFENEYGVIV